MEKISWIAIKKKIYLPQKKIDSSVRGLEPTNVWSTAQPLFRSVFLEFQMLSTKDVTRGARKWQHHSCRVKLSIYTDVAFRELTGWKYVPIELYSFEL